jgi:hypothetical protein
MARFSVQAYLAEMRTESREDMQVVRESQDRLEVKVDEGFKAATKSMSDHVLEDTTKFSSIDKRLDVVENTRRTMRWLMGAAVVAFLGAAAEFIFNHASHIVKP